MKNKPRIRFKGFAEDWEQCKLGEFADITKLAGFEFTKYIVYSDKGNIIALRGLNIKDGDLNLEDVKYIDSSDFTKLKRSKLFRNDILFTYVGTIGEVARIQEDGKYYLAPNVSRIRIKNRLLSEFLMYYMDRDLFYQKIIFPLIATSSQPALSMANIREFNITYPCDINEQQKIALVFSLISHLITLHQRKLEKLKLAKKALLQKLFPKNGSKFPELRFKGFADAWEQRKLDEVFQIIDGDRGKNYPGTSNFLSNGDVLLLDTGNVRKDGFNFDNKRYIDFKRDKLLRNGRLILGDYVLTSRGTLGNLAYYSQSIYDIYPHIRINSAMLILRVLNTIKVNNLYLYITLRSNVINKFMKHNFVGSAQPHITKKEFSSVFLPIPQQLEEQKMIGDFFDHLENIITLHQRKLDKLQEVKKGLLQKMFV